MGARVLSYVYFLKMLLIYSTSNTHVKKHILGFLGLGFRVLFENNTFNKTNRYLPLAQLFAHLEYASSCVDEGCAGRRMSGDSRHQNMDCFL